MTSFFAMKTWNFASLAFPIYLILVSLAVVFAITHKKFLPKKHGKAAESPALVEND
jgi:cbb3-type cytochrome oxidase subunit 3